MMKQFVASIHALLLVVNLVVQPVGRAILLWQTIGSSPGASEMWSFVLVGAKGLLPRLPIFLLKKIRAHRGRRRGTTLRGSTSWRLSGSQDLAFLNSSASDAS